MFSNQSVYVLKPLHLGKKVPRFKANDQLLAFPHHKPVYHLDCA